MQELHIMEKRIYLFGKEYIETLHMKNILIGIKKKKNSMDKLNT